MIEPLLVHAKRNMAEQLKLLRKQLATAPKSALPAREGLHFYTSGPDTKAQVQDKMGELKRLRMALSSYTLETFREDFLYATTRVLVGVRGCILDRSLVLNLNQGILFPNLERLTGSRGMFKTFREAMNQYNVDPYIDFEEYQSAGLDANNPQSVGKFPLEFQSESCLWPLELALTMSDEFRRFLHKLVYVGPMRLFPSRYYLPETIVADTVGKTGEFSPTLLLKEPDLLALVNEWLARLKITYQFEVVKLVAKEADFEEGVFALRLRHRGTAMSSSIVDVGFGVSQLLPVVLKCLLSKKSTICIEQPEIHLHPALQAELGDLFIESALGDDKNTLILETHSEHMILRILKRIRQTSSGTLPTGLAPVTTEQVQVIYVRPTELGTKVHHIGVTDEGEFSDRWPDGFFPERGEELFE